MLSVCAGELFILLDYKASMSLSSYAKRTVKL